MTKWQICLTDLGLCELYFFCIFWDFWNLNKDSLPCNNNEWQILKKCHAGSKKVDTNRTQFELECSIWKCNEFLSTSDFFLRIQSFPKLKLVQKEKVQIEKTITNLFIHFVRREFLKLCKWITNWGDKPLGLLTGHGPWELESYHSINWILTRISWQIEHFMH